MIADILIIDSGKDHEVFIEIIAHMFGNGVGDHEYMTSFFLLIKIIHD